MILDLKVAAARLGICYATARKMAKAGMLPAFHIAGRRKWSVDETDLEQFVATSKAGPEVGPGRFTKPRKMAPNVAGQKKAKILKGQWMRDYA